MSSYLFSEGRISTRQKISAFIRRIIKRPINKLGIDLVVYDPHHTIGRYAYLLKFDIKTVIDTGAHAGDFARTIKRLLPGARIISIEPLKDIFVQLENSMRGVPGFSAFNCALGETNTTRQLHCNTYTYSSSLLPMTNLHKRAFPHTTQETMETVEVRRLDDLLDGLALQPDILVKLDVQGYEDKVIAGGERLIERAKVLIIEVSFQELYEGQPLFDDIYRLLKSKGFTYMGNIYQLLNPLDDSILQADAIFIRE
jgi:FkbM family methyltransferase